MPFRTTLLGHTNEKRPLELAQFGSAVGPWILLLGGVHGDEVEGVWLMEEAVRRWQATDFSIGVRVWANANPDGIAAGHRWNGRKIDLNRNLPSKDWSPEITNPKYPPGPAAASEPETQALVRLITEQKPSAILSAHSFHRFQVNINGPSKEWGEKIAALCGYPVTEDIGYPTPGCLGTYSGKELGIPTITLEIERGLPKEKVISLHMPVLESTVSYWTEKVKQ